jgi:hypothetical protein
MSEIEDVYVVAKKGKLEGIDEIPAVIFYSIVYVTPDKEKAIKVAKYLAEEEGEAFMWEAKCFRKA